MIPFIITMFAVLKGGGSRCTAAIAYRQPTAGFAARRGRTSFPLRMLAGEGGRQSAAVTQDKSKKPSTSEKLDLAPPRGTRDFYPEDMRLQRWLFSHWQEVARLHGFSEYDSPVLENEALYIRKAGEEVSQQLYNFEDKGGRAVSLRPEMTPSLARMVMAKKRTLSMPLKWYSIPQCWRYERMTRGRRREHYQWNMDIWGVAGPTAEAELLGCIVAFFQRVGLTADDIGVKVNSRQVLSELLNKLGVPDDKFAPTCVLLDKLDKVPLEAVRGDLEALGLSTEVIDSLGDVRDVKTMDQLKDLLGDDSPAHKHLTSLFSIAEAYGFQEWLDFDISVVRGLAYYTGVVFEGFDRSGEFRAICGGGRYDELLTTFGGDPLEAAGFGFGDAVIIELLKAKDMLPEFKTSGTQYVVCALSPDLHPTAVKVATSLRDAGVSADLVLDSKKKLKWVLKHTDRLGARYLVLVGEDEWKMGKVKVKDMALGSQEDMDVDSLGPWAAAYVTECE